MIGCIGCLSQFKLMSRTFASNESLEIELSVSFTIFFGGWSTILLSLSFNVLVDLGTGLKNWLIILL